SPAAAFAALRNTSRSRDWAGPPPTAPTRRSVRRRARSSPAAARTTPPATIRGSHRTDSGAAHALRSGSAPPLASEPALQFFCDQVLQCRVVQRHLRVHALELGVLGFQLLHPAQVRRL